MGISTSYEELQKLVSDAGQSRFCPPAAMFLEKEDMERVTRHAEWCAPCAKMLADHSAGDKAALETLTEMLNEPLLSAPQPEEIRKGQIWCLSADAAGWGEYDMYFHAPLALILEVFPYGVVKVAHISTFGELAGPDDLPLGEEFDGAFAEMWNTWSAPAAWLDVCLGKIARGAIAAYHLFPGNAPHLEKNSPRADFREQELYHSAHFALRAMDMVAHLANMGS